MRIVKPKDEEVDAVLLRANMALNSRPKVGEEIEADFHREVRGMLTKRQQGYVMGAFRDTVAYQSAAYAEGVKDAIEWVVNGGPSPLPEE